MLRNGVYCISATMLQMISRWDAGGWTQQYEQLYQQARRRFLAQRQLRSGRVQWQTAMKFDRMQLSRMCAFLRQREPDDCIGYSTLVYRITDEQAWRYMQGPPPEMD